MATPSTLSYGTVVGQFLVSASDGADADTLPDSVPASGTVTFTPSAGLVLDYSVTPNPSAILKKGIVCTLDSDGYLVGPNGSRGVKLIATDDPNTKPVGWTWTATYALVADGEPLRSLTQQAFFVPANTTVDLIVAMPIEESKGVFFSKGDKGDIGLSNILTVGSVTVGEPNVYISGDSPSQEISFSLPVSELQIGTVTTDPSVADEVVISSVISSERNVYTQPARGAVMFSLDDNRAQNAELVAVHDALGQKITLAITSDWVDQVGRLTSEQILAYHNAGHEIANHSKSHMNYAGGTAANRAIESDTCSQFIYNLTGRWPSTFVYPQGAWNAASHQELYTRFRSWALTCSVSTNAPLMYELGDDFPAFYRLDLDAPGNLERAKELIRMAAYSPVIVSFYTHWTDQPGTMTTAQYASIAQLAADLNVPAVLPRDAFGGLSNLNDPSFEVAGIPNWVPANTGSATATRLATTPDAGISGAHALSLNATYPDTALVAQGVSLKPGTYKVSGRVKLLSGNLITNDVGLTARYRKWDETAISLQTFYPTVGANGVWSRFTFDLTVPALTKLAYFQLFNTPGATNTRSGVALFDHLDIRSAEQGDFG